LSDFFFVLARYIGHKENIDETIWKNDWVKRMD
jgi:cob(I)alamin adenosyltransferase